MSASMSVGPPPIRCGESFTNEKVALTNNLNCGPRGEGVLRRACAVELVGPEAEIDCDDYTLSQIATSPRSYLDGPFTAGICLKNGAKAINCNVQRFYAGIDAQNAGEVVNSNLSFNYVGMYAYFDEDATLTIEDT